MTATRPDGAMLVTGGTGLVGNAVVEALGDVPTISLSRTGPRRDASSRTASASSLLPELLGHVANRVAQDGGDAHVSGDITEPMLGLDRAEYERLAARVNVVVHAAGVSDFTTPRRTTHARNVEGTRHVVEFAERAGVPLYHLSTGYLNAEGRSLNGRWGAAVYLESKRQAEAIVAASHATAAIVRPSVVWADSRTGWSPSFQGLHRLVGMMFESKLPLLPFGPQTRVDFLPRDMIGSIIAGLVTSAFEGEFWLTAGPAAPEFGRLVELVLSCGEEHGLELHPPRFVDLDMVDRLIRPVGGETVSRRIDLLLALTSHFTSQDLLPTSLADPSAIEIETAFIHGVEYWARRSGYASAAEMAK